MSKRFGVIKIEAPKTNYVKYIFDGHIVNTTINGSLAWGLMMGPIVCYLASLIIHDRCLLPLLDIKETRLIVYPGLKLSSKATHGGHRIYRGKLPLPPRSPIYAVFYVKTDTRRLTKIELSADEQQQCRKYEVDLRRLRGRESDAEWGSRAYEITWRATGNLPAVYFWLFAYDGSHTHCRVTFGAQQK